jgi:hypothetical protein
MIKEIKSVRAKYERIAKDHNDYVSVQEVISDLRGLEADARIKRLPKNQR